MASSSSLSNKSSMEKPTTTPDPHQQPLKCPRCDSSNTKFCYYNNYSLSQPRHFCKSCKRYWTRGGTLRNVPVGGGCRKNKRSVKKPQPGQGGGDGVSVSVSVSVSSSVGNGHVQLPQLDLSRVSSHINTSLFYNMPSTTNPLELNFPFSRFSTTRVSSGSFDLHQQPQMSGVGLGFLSELGQNQNHNQGRSQDFELDPVFSGSAFGSTSSMVSLLASSIPQQNSFPVLMPCDPGMRSENGVKELKMEGENRSDWNQNNHDVHDHHQQMINSSDTNSSLLWNNTNNLSAWFDPSNMGSSVPSLI